MSTSWGMTRSQFKRRLKRARRASQRLANDRSQAGILALGTLAAAKRPDRTTATNNLIGRNG